MPASFPLRIEEPALYIPSVNRSNITIPLSVDDPAEAIRFAESAGERDLNPEEWLALLDGVAQLAAGAPSTWSAQQRTIVVWSVGESLRRSLRAQPDLRNDPSIWVRVESIVGDPRFARGRESFVMLLGQYDQTNHTDILVELLDDEEIAGHALHALRLLGSPDGIFRARRLAETSSTWVRSEARKYLRKVDPAGRD